LGKDEQLQAGCCTTGDPGAAGCGKHGHGAAEEPSQVPHSIFHFFHY
jgi:hypothetical protein